MDNATNPGTSGMAGGIPGHSAPPLGKKLQVEKEDFAQMARLIGQDEQAIRRLGDICLYAEGLKKQISDIANEASAARAERDKFFLHIEQKYAIPKGTRWGIDFNERCVRINS